MSFSGIGKVMMNGTHVDWKDATVHVAIHVVHHGTGVFEGIRACDSTRGTNVFRLHEHMRRLGDSCRVRGELPHTFHRLAPVGAAVATR